MQKNKSKSKSSKKVQDSRSWTPITDVLKPKKADYKADFYN